MSNKPWFNPENIVHGVIALVVAIIINVLVFLAMHKPMH